MTTPLETQVRLEVLVERLSLIAGEVERDPAMPVSISDRMDDLIDHVNTIIARARRAVNILALAVVASTTAQAATDPSAAALLLPEMTRIECGAYSAMPATCALKPVCCQFVDSFEDRPTDVGLRPELTRCEIILFTDRGGVTSYPACVAVYVGDGE